MTIKPEILELVCAGTAAAQERVWRFLEETSAWLYTLQIPRDAQKVARLDLHRGQCSTSAMVVFMGAAQSQLDVRRNIQIFDLDSSLNPAVQQYALVGSIAALDTALREDTTVDFVSMCQKHGFTFLSVHTTDTPR